MIAAPRQSEALLEHFLQEPPPKGQSRFQFLERLSQVGRRQSAVQHSTNSADHEVRNFILFACMVSFVLLMSFLAMPNRHSPKTSSRPVLSIPLDPRLVKGGGDISSQTERKASPPRNVLPIHYDLELNVSQLDNARTFTGKVNIVVECVEKSWTTITAHASNVTVHQANISTYSGSQQISNVVVKHQSQPELEDIVVFDLGFELVNGTVYNLSATFTGMLRDKMEGLFVKHFSGDSGETSNILSANLMYGKARMVFPCFDDPYLKATFNLSVIRRKKFESLSNWDIETTFKLAGDERKDVFEAFPPISPSQLTLSVFNGLDMQNDGYSKLFALKYDVPYLDLTLKSFVKMLKYMDSLLNISLPFKKYSIVALPDIRETIAPSWGLVILGTSAMAYDEDSHDDKRREEVLLRLAHVVAHQWFGNLVSPRHWDDIWIYEGLAFIFQKMIMKNVFGSQISDSLFGRRVRDVLGAEDVKKRLSKPSNWFPAVCDHPFVRKAEAIMDVMMRSLPQDGFVKSVSSFVNRSRFASAGARDLLVAFGPLDNTTDLADKMETWINNVGYPLITAKRHLKPSNVYTVSQMAFCYGGIKCLNQTWQVPINYTVYKVTGENVTEMMWLLQAENQVSFNLTEGDLVLFNAHGMGYYRVNYELREWGTIINAMKNSSFFEPSTKLRLLDDAYKLAESGVTPYSNFFEAASTLRSETERNIWAVYGEIASSLDGVLLHSQFDEPWRDFNSRLLEKLVFRIRNQDALLSSKALKKDILGRACWYGEHQCLQLAREVVNDYLTEGRGKPHGTLPDGTLLCAGILHSPVEVWDMLWSKMFSMFARNNTRVLLDPILQGLSCTPNPQRIWKLLNETLVSTLLRKHRSFVMHCIATSGTASQLLLEFMLSNWNETGGEKGSDDHTIGDLVFQAVSRDAKSSRDVVLLTSALAKAKGNKVVAAALAAAIDRTKYYRRWHKEHSGDMVKALAA